MKKRKNYLFNFADFIKEERENPEKRQAIEDFEKNYGPIEGKNVEDLPFYTEFLSRYDIKGGLKGLALEYPMFLEDDFDYDLLQRLVFNSLSSEYELKVNDDGISYKLLIYVKSGNEKIMKSLDELWSFQIERLFEIYLEEAINRYNLCAESEIEAKAVHAEMEPRVALFQKTAALVQNQAENFRALNELLNS